LLRFELDRRSVVSDQHVKSSDLLEIAKRKGFRKNYGPTVGALSLSALDKGGTGWIVLVARAAVAGVYTFWRSHEVVRRLLATKPNEGAFSEAEFVSVYRAANKRSALGNNTIRAYAMRMLRWLIGIDLVRETGNSLVLRDALTPSSIQSFESIVTKRPQLS